MARRSAIGCRFPLMGRPECRARRRLAAERAGPRLDGADYRLCLFHPGPLRGDHLPGVLRASGDAARTLLRGADDNARGTYSMLLGAIAGAVMAAIVFSITVISFPLLMDRDIDFATAMTASVRASSLCWVMRPGICIRRWLPRPCKQRQSGFEGMVRSATSPRPGS